MRARVAASSFKDVISTSSRRSLGFGAAVASLKERERGTTNGIMHAFSEFPMGVGAVYALTFLAFYAYFSRFESARAVAAESASA